MNTTIAIRKPDDFHCHFRTGQMLQRVVPFTAAVFARAIAMPNTKPSKQTRQDAIAYRGEILDAVGNDFQPLMTIEVTDRTTPKMIKDAVDANVIAGKFYPQGVTTNSQNGVSDFDALNPVFAEMERCRMRALFHGEDPSPGVFCLDRERSFLKTLRKIVETFPELKIVLEHVSTDNALFAVSTYDNVAATITAHHLLLTLDDVVGGLISPHNFCKPLAKRPEDRDALLKAATSGNPKFFFGSDSAPHSRGTKECAHGCAGCFTAPVVLPLLAQIFEECDALDKLQGFVSEFGADFYGLPRNTGTITLFKEDWVVPEEYEGTALFWGGKTLHWKTI